MPQSKIIRAKFGAEGYGIYISLLEVIGENVLENNKEEWGQAPKIHDLGSLAVECATTPEKLKEFLEFCDSREIFGKKNGRLFTSLILDRLDNYAKRIKRSENSEQGSTEEVPSTNNYELSTDQVRTTTNKVELSTTLQSQTQLQIQTQKERIPAPPVAGTLQKQKDPPKPKEQTELQRIVKHLSDVTGATPANFGKQAQAWKAMQKAGYSEKNICFAIDDMWEQDYWRDKGLDLTTVMNNIAKIKQKYLERRT